MNRIVGCIACIIFIFYSVQSCVKSRTETAPKSLFPSENEKVLSQDPYLELAQNVHDVSVDFLKSEREKLSKDEKTPKSKIVEIAYNYSRMDVGEIASLYRNTELDLVKSELSKSKDESQPSQSLPKDSRIEYLPEGMLIGSLAITGIASAIYSKQSNPLFEVTDFYKQDDLKATKYLSIDELERTKVDILDGKFYWRHNKQPVNVDKLPSMYVIDSSGQLHIQQLNWMDGKSLGDNQKLAHSSFLGGYLGNGHPHSFPDELVDPRKAKVMSAGHIEIKNGVLVHFDNLSGHYRPSRDALENTRSLFSKNQVQGLQELSVFHDQFYRGAYSTVDQIPQFQGAVNQFEVDTKQRGKIKFSEAEGIKWNSVRKHALKIGIAAGVVGTLASTFYVARKYSGMKNESDSLHLVKENSPEMKYLGELASIEKKLINLQK